MKSKEDLIEKRLYELAEISEQQNRFVYSEFLTMQELDSFYTVFEKLDCFSYKMWGGAEFCERKMIRFGNSDGIGYEEEFPIRGILIEPTSMKFASELSHRDYLGALLNLGIERSKIGDILIKEKSAYVFCNQIMADYIAANLERVGRNTVRVKQKGSIVDEQWMPQLESNELSVISLRLDVVVAAVWKLSRSQSQAYFRERKVFINGRIIENHSYMLKENDLITVRGFGKFYFRGTSGTSRKNKVYIIIEKYI